MSEVSMDEVLIWMKRRPKEPFYFIRSGDKLACGFRTDEGEVTVYECKIIDSDYHFAGPRRRVSGGKP